MTAPPKARVAIKLTVMKTMAIRSRIEVITHPFVPFRRRGYHGGWSNFPRGSGMEERGQVAGADPLLGVDQLVLHGIAVRGAVDGPEDADGCRLEGPARQTGEHERQPRLVTLLVVDEDLVLAHLGHVDDLRSALAVEDHTPGPVGSEANGLAVLERDQHLGPCFARRDLLEGAVVEDVAVLVDLDERPALVVVGPAERLHHVLAVHVVGA